MFWLNYEQIFDFFTSRHAICNCNWQILLQTRSQLLGASVCLEFEVFALHQWTKRNIFFFSCTSRHCMAQARMLVLFHDVDIHCFLLQYGSRHHEKSPIWQSRKSWWFVRWSVPMLEFLFSFPLYLSRSVKNECSHFQYSHICHWPKVIHMQTASQSVWPIRMENVSWLEKPHLRCHATLKHNVQKLRKYKVQ